jgi:hypothetical protein
MTKFKVLDGGIGQSRTADADGLGSGNGGGDGGGLSVEQRVLGLEKAQIQIGMDMQYLKGKIEDMPTKDWMHTRMSAYAAGLAAIMIIGLTVIGFLVNP